MAAVVIHQPIPRQSLTPPPQPPLLSSDNPRSHSVPIPNKHLPYCPPGPSPESQHSNLATPPESPPSKNSTFRTESVLHPAATHTKVNISPPVYSIDASILNAAIIEQARQIFPDPNYAFPWLHGLHSENQVQLAFFTARRKAQRDTPECFRSITIVKAGGNLNKARLKGALSPDEILNLSGGREAYFLEADPREGFSIRNFQIQATKMAMVSDIVVYGDKNTQRDEVLNLARKVSVAQSSWRVKGGNIDDEDAPVFSTFVLSSKFQFVATEIEPELTSRQDSFQEVETSYPELVATCSQGKATGHVIDFCEL